jgi:hypothetical protein
MNRTIKVSLLVILGSMIASPYAKNRVADEQEDATVRFRLRSGYQIIVPVSVNRLEPLNFILDTGTKTTMIDERISRKLNLTAVARMPLITFTGTVFVDIVRLDTLVLGQAAVRGHEVSCVDLRKVFSLGSDIDGILGQDFLSQFNYLLDYQRRRIVLEENGDLEKEMLGVRILIEQRDYRDHVHVDSGSESRAPRVRLMLDSGTEFPVMFEDPKLNSVLQLSRDHAPLSIRGALGSRPIKTGRIRSLRIGDELFRDLPVRLARAREIERRWENGLFPTSLLRVVYFNHEKAYVIVNPELSRTQEAE